MFLRIWIALHVISFVLGVALIPRPALITRSLVWTMLMFLLAWAMFRHHRAAWVIAVLLAAFAFAAAVAGLWELGLAISKERLWYLWGIPFGLANLVVLLSLQARDWIDQSTERTGAYSSLAGE